MFCIRLYQLTFRVIAYTIYLGFCDKFTEKKKLDSSVVSKLETTAS